MFFPLEGNRYFIAWELEFLFSRWMQLSGIAKFLVMLDKLFLFKRVPM